MRNVLGSRKSGLAKQLKCDSVHTTESFWLGWVMLEEDHRSEGIFSYVQLEQRVPADSPLGRSAPYLTRPDLSRALVSFTRDVADHRTRRSGCGERCCRRFTVRSERLAQTSQNPLSHGRVFSGSLDGACRAYGVR